MFEEAHNSNNLEKIGVGTLRAHAALGHPMDIQKIDNIGTCKKRDQVRFPFWSILFGWDQKYNEEERYMLTVEGWQLIDTSDDSELQAYFDRDKPGDIRDDVKELIVKEIKQNGSNQLKAAVAVSKHYGVDQ